MCNLTLKSLTTSHFASVNTNVYFRQILDVINPSENVLDIGINMSRNCSFDTHINIYI